MVSSAEHLHGATGTMMPGAAAPLPTTCCHGGAPGAWGAQELQTPVALSFTGRGFA